MTKLGHMRDWTGAEDEIYIGRAGHGFDGYFGNPCHKNVKCAVCKQIHTTRMQTIKCYEFYARQRMKEDEEFKSRIKALHGKKLMCFCTPKPCHGEVLIKLAAELNTKGRLF
jgi:hypothetical protein